MSNQTLRNPKQLKRKLRKQRRIEARLTGQDVTFAVVSCDIVQAAEGAAPTVRIVAYSGGPLALRNFDHPVIIDLSSVTAHGGGDQLPLLRDHDTARPVGHGKPIVDLDALRVDGVLSVEGTEKQQLISASQQGFRWQASVGGRIIDRARNVRLVAANETVTVNGKTHKGPVYVVRGFLWKETSFTALGADEYRATAHIAASATGKREVLMNEFELWLQACAIDPDSKSDEELGHLKAAFQAHQQYQTKTKTGTVTAKEGEVEDGTRISKEEILGAVRSDALRLGRIDRLFASYSSDTALKEEELDDLRVQAVGGKISEDALHLKLLQSSRAKHTSNVARGVTHARHSELDALTLEAAVHATAGVDDKHIEASLRERGVPDDKVLAAINESKSSRWSGLGVKAVILAACEQAGHSVFGARVGNEEIEAAFRHSLEVRATAGGFSTVSLPGILSRVANKAMLSAYAEADNGGVALQIASVTSTSDFKKFDRYRLTESGVLEEVGPGGEIKHTTLMEEAYENQIRTYGKMIVLTRQMQINDDLDAFMQLPRMLGRMGRHALERATVTKLVDAPVGATAADFFRSAALGNLQPNLITTGSALSIDSLGDAYKLFLNQTDADGKPIMIDPAILLVTNDNIVAARKLYNDTEFRFEPANAGTGTETIQNQWKGMFTPLKSSYLGRLGTTPSTTQWYLMAGPTLDQSALQVAFLNNQRTPTIEQGDVDFNRLGIAWRSFFDFGVALMDPRAVVKATGAA